MYDLTQIQYAQMAEIARCFGTAAESVSTLTSTIRAVFTPLEEGEGEGSSATTCVNLRRSRWNA